MDLRLRHAPLKEHPAHTPTHTLACQAVCGNDKALRLCGGRVPGSTSQDTQAFARALHLAIELSAAALRLQPPPPPPARTPRGKRRRGGAAGGAGASAEAASSAVVLTGASAEAEAAAAAEAAGAAGAAGGAAASRAQLVLHLAVHARKLWHVHHSKHS